MPFLWTPEPAEPLFEGLETAQNLTLNIAVTPDAEAAVPSVPKITQWQLTGSDTLIQKAQSTQTDDSLTLFFADLDGALPILSIDYLFPAGLEVFSVNNWGDLPDQTLQIFNYQKDSSSPKTLQLIVTATDETGQSETVRYKIIVHGDYSAGKDALTSIIKRPFA